MCVGVVEPPKYRTEPSSSSSLRVNIYDKEIERKLNYVSSLNWLDDMQQEIKVKLRN